MPSSKIITKNLNPSIAQKLETLNIKTFSSLEQIGLETGSETIETIISAMPDYSILHLAITDANNTEIYPNPTGTLIIEDIIETGATFRFYAKVDETPKFWKGLYVDGSFSGWGREFNELDPLGNVGGGSSKLKVYPQELIYATEGQTEFDITLETFDPVNDTVLVQRGMLLLNPNGDYTVEGNKVVLSEGADDGQSIGIWVWKNVPVIDEEDTISGSIIEPGSIPIDRLAEMPNMDVNVTSDFPIHFSITADNELKISWGEDINKESTIV